MANIVPQTPTSAGVQITYAPASAGGDTVTPGKAQNVKLVVRNASAASVTVTFHAKIACSRGFMHDTPVPCAVGDTEVVIPGDCYDPTTGNVSLTYSASASVTVAAIAG